jgi:hypothetical protein
MRVEDWDYAGSAEMTEYWRSVVPDLASDPETDKTGVSNDQHRVVEVRRRFALELKHIGRGSGPSVTRSSITRLADWSAMLDADPKAGHPGPAWALARGVPSRLAAPAEPLDHAGLDFALLIVVPPELLPNGLLTLAGVPLVIGRHRPFRPLPDEAHDVVAVGSAIAPRE